MPYDYEELHRHLESLGFTVKRCGKEGAGKYTDEHNTRCVSYELRLGVYKFSGNYKATRESGTGWAFENGPKNWTKEEFTAMLYADAPSWTQNKNPVYLNIDGKEMKR